MHVDLSLEDRRFADEVRAWFEANTPAELRGDAFMFGTMTPEQNVAWARKLNERGWAAIHWPKEHGGTDWSQTRKYLFEQIRAETRAPIAYNMGVNLLGPVLYTFGTEAQKAYYLPRILRFEDWWCQGYSEPGAGSDLAALQTRAERRGERYVVNGSKIWTSYAHRADRIFCLVRTGTGARKQEGISFLLVDMDTPGVAVRPITSIDGRHHLNQVFFDDVAVPAENLVGEEGQGWSIAKYLLTHERTNIARIPLSMVELEKLKALARRAAGAGCVADGESLARRIAEVEIELGCLAFTNAQMLAATDAGRAPGAAESALLKIRGTEIQQAIAELRLEVAGYEGYGWRRLAERAGAELAEGERDLLQAAVNYSFSRAASIYGGSNEIQRNVMAKALLGLP